MPRHSAFKTKSPKERYQATSMGVLTDAPMAKRAAQMRWKGRIDSIRKKIVGKAHASKRKRKRIQRAAFLSAMLAAFSLFSVFFGDMIFSLDAQGEPWIEDGYSEFAEQPPAMVDLEIAEENSANAIAERFPEDSLTDMIAEQLSEDVVADAVPTRFPGEEAVFYSANGNRYHATATCSGMREAMGADIDHAKALGLTPCKRCDPPE